MRLVESAVSTADPKVVLLPFDWNGTVEEAFYTHYYPLLKQQAATTGADPLASLPPAIRKKVIGEHQKSDAFRQMVSVTTPPTPADEERIYAAKVRVRRKNSMLGDILQEIPTIYVGPPSKGGIDTFAIDHNSNLLINLGFAKSLTDAQLDGVLAHEALHVALEHHLRLKGRKPFVFANIAMDGIINGGLASDGYALPEGGVQTSYDKKVWLWILYVENDIPDFKVANPRLLHVGIPMSRRGWEEVFDEIKAELDPKKQNKHRVWVPGDIVYDSLRKTFGRVDSVYGAGNFMVTEISQDDAEKALQAKEQAGGAF